MGRSLSCLLLPLALARLVAADPTAPSLWAPRFATPALVQPGGRFTAEVIAPPGLESDGWQAWLTTDLGKRWPCEVDSAR